MTDYTLVRSRRRTLSMELKRDGTVVVHASLRLGVEQIDRKSTRLNSSQNA